MADKTILRRQCRLKLIAVTLASVCRRMIIAAYQAIINVAAHGTGVSGAGVGGMLAGTKSGGGGEGYAVRESAMNRRIGDVTGEADGAITAASATARNRRVSLKGPLRCRMALFWLAANVRLPVSLTTAIACWRRR